MKIKLLSFRQRTAPPIHKSQSHPQVSIHQLGRNTRKTTQSAPNLRTVQGVSEYRKTNEEKHKKQLKAIEVFYFFIIFKKITTIQAFRVFFIFYWLNVMASPL